MRKKANMIEMNMELKLNFLIVNHDEEVKELCKRNLYHDLNNHMPRDNILEILETVFTEMDQVNWHVMFEYKYKADWM